MKRRIERILLVVWSCSALWLGCFEPDPEVDDADSGDGGAEGRRPKIDAGAASCRGIEIQTGGIDKVDVLFVIDNAGDMVAEQAALRDQFPRLLRTMTTGDMDGDGQADIASVGDIHLGVVSSDMGLPGISGLPNCEGLGDDGVLQRAGDTALAGCEASYPAFISFDGGAGQPPDQAAIDLSCVAALGTSGCGFEQPLEAALKALWPAVDRGGNGATDPNGAEHTPNRVTFPGDPSDGSGTTGHGDGENAGFLRNDPTTGLSVIAVVVVTTEDDCSSIDTDHFTPPQQLDPSDPLAMQSINLRCFFNKDRLFDVERYRDALQALRPDAQSLVVFGAIVGVPPDLVDASLRAQVDFSNPAQHEAHYQRILNDPRMQEVLDPDSSVENLAPSCVSDLDGDGMATDRAFPPRRIVEVARLFEQNGFVGSICQADFTDSIDMLATTVAAQLGTPCLPRPLVRGSDGTVGCELRWELPAPGEAPASSPTACDQLPFLEAVDEPADGRVRCRVQQRAVQDGVVPAGDGWFYDDFSDEVAGQCPRLAPQRISFSASAKPPAGVAVRLHCCD